MPELSALLDFLFLASREKIQQRLSAKSRPLVQTHLQRPETPHSVVVVFLTPEERKGFSRFWVAF